MPMPRAYIPATPIMVVSPPVAPPPAPEPPKILSFEKHPLGLPTYPAPAPTGFQWMGSDSAGGWVEGWVFVGNPHATGDSPGQDETAKQYAQRKGVPLTILGTITSYADVNDWRRAQPNDSMYDPTWVAAHKGSDQFKVPASAPYVPPTAPRDVQADPQPIDPARQKRLEIEAALISIGKGVTGSSIYNNPVGQPSELNNIMGSFNPALGMVQMLQAGQDIAQVIGAYIGQKGYEAYTAADVQALAAAI